MTTENFLLTKIDPDTERRRALAKVYSLLLRLAEQANTELSDQEPVREIKGEELPSKQTASLTKEPDTAASQQHSPP